MKSTLPRVTRAMMDRAIRRGGATSVEWEADGWAWAFFDDPQKGRDLAYALPFIGIAACHIDHGRKVYMDLSGGAE